MSYLMAVLALSAPAFVAAPRAEASHALTIAGSSLTPPPGRELGPWVLNPFHPGVYCYFRPEHLRVGIPGNAQFYHGPRLTIRFPGRQDALFEFSPEWRGEVVEQEGQVRLRGASLVSATDTVGQALSLPLPVAGQFDQIESLEISADGRPPYHFVLARIDGSGDEAAIRERLVRHGCVHQVGLLGVQDGTRRQGAP